MPLVAKKETEDGLPDSEIVQRVSAGDNNAFTLLMRRYNQSLYRTARSILRDDVEAEDVLQDAYLLAYRGIKKFRGDAKLSTWLTRIVVNEAVARLRKATRRAKVIRLDCDMEPDNQPIEANTSDVAFEPPEGMAMRAEARRLLEAKIDALPEVFRTVFVLRALEEMTVEEVALALDIPEATVRTRYFRARGSLREALSREIDFAFEEAFTFAGDRCDRVVAGVVRRLAMSGEDDT
jgi:RNA polymerase sigma-70 factor (ECF subfamily)